MICDEGPYHQLFCKACRSMRKVILLWLLKLWQRATIRNHAHWIAGPNPLLLISAWKCVDDSRRLVLGHGGDVWQHLWPCSRLWQFLYNLCSLWIKWCMGDLKRPQIGRLERWNSIRVISHRTDTGSSFQPICGLFGLICTYVLITRHVFKAQTRRHAHMYQMTRINCVPCK